MSRRTFLILVAVILLAIVASAKAMDVSTCTPVNDTPGTCKEGDCAGYPNGICESDPTGGGKDGKDYNETPDSNRNYFDIAGNEYDYAGNLIHKAPTPPAPKPDTTNDIPVDNTPGDGK